MLRKVDAAAAAPGGSVVRVPLEIDATRILKLQSGFLSQRGFAVAAAALATDLALLLSAERVAVGMCKRAQTRVVAVSHVARIVTSTEQLDLIGAAMDEALQQETSLTYPEISGARPLITAAHAACARGGTHIATIPLVSQGRAFGALTLLRAGDVPFNEHELAQCEKVSIALGPLLQLKYDAERGWWGRLLGDVRQVGRALTGPGRAGLKSGAAAGVLAIALLALVPMSYRIGAPARVEGAIQRVLAAPADGFLRELHARPGDQVKQGQVLAELAQDDLRLEQRKWGSELAQHENTAAAALARSDRAQYVVSQARAEEARAQLDLASQQLERTRVVAPFDGVVIAGDLTQTLGAPIQRGETLLTIAPDQQFRLLIEVDERDIQDVRIGASGQLALGALIGHSLPFEVVRVTPMASSREGRNFFEVEGKFEGKASDLRPGLQGVAKIEAGRRTLAWSWTHRFFDWLRLTLWSWGM